VGLIDVLMLQNYMNSQVSLLFSVFGFRASGFERKPAPQSTRVPDVGTQGSLH
jgi:hypothetical protein